MKKLIRSYNFLIERTLELDEMLESSKLIYNQALYHLRRINDKQFKQSVKLSLISYEDLYSRVKDEDCYIESCLDTMSKTYAIRQAREMMLSFIRAANAYKKNKKNFTVGLDRLNTSSRRTGMLSALTRLDLGIQNENQTR